MADEFSVFGWLKETNIQAAIIGPLISSLIGGGAFLWHQSNSKKSNLSDLIQEIEELAIEHWCSPSADSNNHFRAIKILSKIKTLGWRINQKKEKNKSALIEYRQAITSEGFDDPNRDFVAFENPRILLIGSKAKNLRKTLGIKKHH